MEVTKNMLYHLYVVEKKSLTTIAKTYGCCHSTILNWLNKFEIQKRNISDCQVHKIIIDKNVLIQLYEINDLSCEDIGKLHNCGSETIRRLLQKYGIKLKSKTRKLAGWNKGLTKKTNEKIRIQAEALSIKRKKLFSSGQITHHNLGKSQPLSVKIKISNSLKGIMVGELSSNWKGGDKNQYRLWRRRITESLEYREFRNKIYIRDNYCCQMCKKQSNGNIELHHIKTVKQYPDLIMEEDNAITLHRRCHSSIRHKEEQYENYFNEIIQSKFKRYAV